MYKRGSKITVWMLAAVFCAFAFAGCGQTDTADSGNSERANEEQVKTDAGRDEAAAADEDMHLTILSPADGETLSGGVVKIVGTAEGSPHPGEDTVYMELTTEDGKKLGEASSLVADLDEAFSADLKYEVSDTMVKNDDETVNANLRVYMNDGSGALMKEETVHVKVK